MYCENCNKQQDGTKVTQIYEAPPILIIALQRMKKGSFDETMINFGLELDLKKYVL
jgi:ubiquitin C-terminal hydrolase